MWSRITGLVVMLALALPAEAARKRVVFLGVSGPQAGKASNMVQRMLAKKFTLVSVKAYVRARKRLRAKGSDSDLSFSAHGAEEFAAQLQAALRSDDLFQRWRNTQADPEAVDPGLAATDPAATVSGEHHNLQVDLIAVTSIPGTVFKHRLRLLAGNGWELRDVSSV